MKDFHQKYKHLIHICIVLATLTALSSYIAYGWRPKTGQNHNAPLLVGEGRVRSQPLSESSPVFSSNDSQTKEKSPQLITDKTMESAQQKKHESKTPSIPSTIPASLTVDGKTYTGTIAPDSTVYDFMKQLIDSGQMNTTFKDYGASLGYLVDSINGVYSSQIKHKFWIYYVNGQKAQIGISNNHLHSGDNITWKYEDDSGM